ncbi:MAG: hypothetical protein GX275_05425 [Clostridiales bacterium]|nr:hypothetical protein [Clostridiales bacterium]
MKKKICLFLSFLLMLSFVGCGKSKEEDNNNPTEETQSKITVYHEDLCDAVYEDFLEINIGDNYDKVVENLGEPNQLDTTNGENLYSWNAKEGYTISLIEKDGKIISKSDTVDSKIKSNVTLEMYKKVELGMTLDEVEAILGKGRLSYEVKDGDNVKSMYAYYNEDNSNAIITYTNKIVSNFSENNLK